MLALLGGVMILIGLVLLPLPIPLGAPLIIVGTVLLTRNAAWARDWLMRFLGRHPGLARRAPRSLLRLLGADG